DKTGLEVLREIKEDPRFSDVPVLMISAEEAEDALVVSLSNGAAEFVRFPLNMAELMVKVQNTLELTQSRRELRVLNAKLEKEKKYMLRYFSHDIVEKILNEEIAAELGGSVVPASVLFFDVRGSTRIAEQIAPQEFAAFISQIFTAVMDLIYDNGGSVNKLLGDGILATFGCPVPHALDTQRSVTCALGIREYFKNFNNVKPSFIKETVTCGVGVATGSVFAGNVGSQRRMEYTVMGDPVNLASRLQALTREEDCDILIDDTTRNALGARINVTQTQNQAIRGKEAAVGVFKLHALNA
ncbi:MAG: adenylate/guanylate cyclase domain-containing response regulator, partial [Spirochaetia bacterium]|nr:adenylate/guanylate cyclase domain-containing response regulator [Spirochaetia bacterium]